MYLSPNISALDGCFGCLGHPVNSVSALTSSVNPGPLPTLVWICCLPHLGPVCHLDCQSPLTMLHLSPAFCLLMVLILDPGTYPRWESVLRGDMLSENLNWASSYIFSFWILAHTLAGNWYWGGMLSENLNWASGS